MHKKILWKIMVIRNPQKFMFDANGLEIFWSRIYVSIFYSHKFKKGGWYNGGIWIYVLGIGLVLKWWGDNFF